MTFVALDSNVLVYAALEPASARGQRAREILVDTAALGLIAAQCLGEFLNVVRRKAPQHGELALRQVEAWTRTFVSAPTDADTILVAGRLAQSHRLQFWDAVILAVSSKHGADLLLSEGMHDGLVLGGIEVLNPFSEANAGRVKARLAR